jgi:hypothetical protein
VPGKALVGPAGKRENIKRLEIWSSERRWLWNHAEGNINKKHI